MQIEELLEKQRKFSAETESHSERVSDYSGIIAMKIGFSAKKTEIIRKAALLHDVGKLAVPSEILHKKGALNQSEYDIVKSHITEGAGFIEQLDENEKDVIDMAKNIALQHHEKWNGTGYLGFKGEDISLEARIVAVADVFDAISSKRCYKDCWDINDAKDVIVKGRGTHFDPVVVDTFVSCFEEIKKINR